LLLKGSEGLSKKFQQERTDHAEHAGSAPYPRKKINTLAGLKPAQKLKEGGDVQPRELNIQDTKSLNDTNL